MTAERLDVATSRRPPRATSRGCSTAAGCARSSRSPAASYGVDPARHGAQARERRTPRASAVRCASMNGPLGGVPPAEQLMTIERDDRDGCLVLVVHGEVDLSTGGRLMEAGSAALHEAADQPVVLDLTGVDFLSSSGLGLLVALTTTAAIWAPRCGRRRPDPTGDPTDPHHGPGRGAVALPHRRRGRDRVRRQP